MMRVLLFVALLGPTLALADIPMAGTWVMQPESTTFGETHPLDLMIERGGFRRSGCGTPIEVPTDGTDTPVKDQPLFDTLAVKIVNQRRVDIVQKLAGRLVWKGVYTVSKDQSSMVVQFHDARASTAVSGSIQYLRQGNLLSGAHALSGVWRPEKLTQLSTNATMLTIQENAQGVAVKWGDGRSAESPINAQYYPMNGYLPGAQISILRPRPDMLAMNREQGVVPVEIVRASVSQDGQTLTYKQTDWVCRDLTTFLYKRQGT
jgi:hypothetical protein